MILATVRHRKKRSECSVGENVEADERLLYTCIRRIKSSALRLLSHIPCSRSSLRE